MKKKGTAYKKMLLSFVTVFCLPLCMVVLFYFYSGNVMEKQVELSNINLLHTICKVSDQELSFYQNILRKFAADSFVRDLGNMEELDTSRYADIEDLTKSVRDSAYSMQNYDGVGKELVLYFPKIDRVMTSESTGLLMASTYRDLLLSGDSSISDALFDQMSIRSDFTATVMENGIFDKRMLLLTRSCWNRFEECYATAGVWMDIEMLSSRISSIDWEYGFDWLILDENNCVLKGAEGIAAAGDVYDIQHDADNSDYFVHSTPSQLTQWRYFLVVPKDIIQDSVGQIRIFFFISLALCLLLGYFLMRKITVMNYAPLQNLMETFQSKRDPVQKKKDEYQYLQEQISSLITTRTDMEKKITRSGDAMKKMALINLLIKPYFRQSGEELEDHIRELDSGRNMVILIKERIQDSQQQQDDTYDGLNMFIIDNVFSEKVGEQFVCKMVELDGRQVLIVADPYLEVRVELLWEIIYDLQQTVMDYFDLAIAVAAGGIHSGLTGIHESYLEALEAEEFIPILEQDCINYHDIRDNTLRKYDYSIQAEERIISAIQNNNVELATAFIDKILEQNFVESQNSSNMRRCLLHDLYCTLLKAADDKDCIERIDVTQHSFTVELPLEELQSKFARLVQRICDVSETQTEISTDKELCQRVLAFVRENYQDRDLNISQTAQHFHMSPSNLSAIYKKETGKSLLKVINEVRIENAVEFLTKGYSVVETAEKVGISESSSFIRLFKKHMGVTPGQMKSRVQGNDDE